MTAHFAAAIVRFRDQTGRIHGAGCVTEGHDTHYVLTCAHVLNRTRGRSDFERAKPDQPFTIDCPFAGTDSYEATVVEWYPAKPEAELLKDPVADLAILRLDRKAPQYLRSDRFCDTVPNPGSRFLTYGFPSGADSGIDAGGELRHPTAGRWLRIVDPVAVGRFVEGGFSGAPVFTDDDRQLVIGIVVAAESPTTKQAYVIPADVIQRAWPLLAHPYPALKAFDERSAPYFFGRNDDTNHLIDKVSQHPLVPVYGASGSGKSSLVFAGLVPRLRQDLSWRIASFQPRGRALYNLAYEALAPLLQSNRAERDARIDFAEKWRERLIERPRRIEEVAQAVLDGARQNEKILLIVDQFEQVFVPSGDKEEDFARQKLLEILEIAPPNLIRIVVTLRAGFIGAAVEHAFLARALQDASVVVGPLTEAGLREAITEPAQRLNVALQAGRPNDAMTLLDRIVSDVSGRAGGLPLMQFALAELWQRQDTPPIGRMLTHDGYEAVGGVEGALRLQAERTFNDLSATEKESALRILPRLARAGEATEDVRHTLARTEVDEADWAVVRKLTEARLLSADRDPVSAEETVEVAHEVIFSAWPRLGELVSQDKEFSLWRQRLGYGLRLWRGSGLGDSALLRDALLNEARSWIDRRRTDLTNDEQDFIDKSTKAAEQAQQERMAELRRQAETEAMLRKEAEQRAVEANDARGVGLGRQLAAQSQVLRIESPKLLDRSALLAIEAARRASGVDIDRSLRSAVGLLPNLLFEYDTQQTINAVAMSANGDLAAAGGSNGTIQIWNTSSGEEIKVFSQGAAIQDLAMTSDGSYMASVGPSGTILLHLTSGEGGSLNQTPGIVVAFGGPLLASSGAEDGLVHVWHFDSLQETHTLALGGAAAAIAFSPDHLLLAAGGTNNIVCVWDLTTGQELMRGEHQPASASYPLRLGSRDGGIFSVAFDPSGKYVVSGGQDHTVRLWEIATGNEVFRVRQSDTIYSVGISPDGRLLASGGMDETARVWSLEDGSERFRLQHGYVVGKIRWSDNGDLLTVSGDGTSRLWSMSTGAELSRMYHSEYIWAGEMSANGRHAITGDSTGSVRIWALSSGGAFLTLPHPGAGSVCINSTGTHLLTIGSTSYAQLWQLPEGQLTHRFHHEPFVALGAFSPDGKIVVTTGWDGQAHLWDVATGERLATVQHQGRMVGARFSPDGRIMVTAGFEDGSACVLDVRDGQELFRLGHEGSIGLGSSFPNGGVRAISFSGNGQILATGGHDGTVRFWNLKTGHETKRLTHRGFLQGILFTQDDHYLITDSAKDVTLWDLHYDKLTATIDKEAANEQFMRVLCISPDNQLLLTSSQKERSVQVRDLQTMEVLANLLHDHTVFSGVFNSQATTVLTASQDKTARVWDTRTWQEIIRVSSTDTMFEAIYSPDESFFVTASNNGQVQLWDAGIDSLVKTARRRLHRTLTPQELRQYLGDSSPTTAPT